MSEQVITPVARPGFSIPDYELLRPIGRGAYGEVWLARNVTGSWVALKIVHRSAFDHDRPFEREFEGIKRFEPISRSDPSQVAILHVGLGDGFFYYVMELADDVAAEVTRLNSKSEIRNPKSEIDQSLLTSAATYQPKTLKRLLNDCGALPAQECLAIALSLTRALAHLHGNGLVHRDVKPSNVIFVNGQAKLADIGLVTSVDATRSFVGTEGYLPPEGAGTPRADLFALGKMLYEMSTGCDRKEFPKLPADIATRPDRDALAELNSIVVRACQLDPRERYTSAEAMQVDLALLQSGRSVKRQHQWQRRWSHAKQAALAAVALAVASALLYSLSLGKPAPPLIKPSRIAAANEEYESGLISLHTGSDDAAKQAIKHFELATRIDPLFAPAWAQLANAYISTGTDRQKVAKSRAAAEEAIKLDPKLAEAYAFRASARSLQLDWSGAEKDGRKARELNPDSEVIALESALNLATMGRTNEAIQMLEKALALGSGSLSVARIRFAGHVYAWCRQYDKAILKYNEVIEKVPPSTARMENVLAQVYLGKGDYSAAIRHGRKAQPLPGETPAEMQARYDALEQAFIEGKERGYWEKQLEFEKPRNDDEGLMQLAAVYAQLDRPADALKLLNEAYERTPTEFAMGIKTNPSFDGLRAEFGYGELIKRLWRKK